jgi:hypothetical protein
LSKLLDADRIQFHRHDSNRTLLAENAFKFLITRSSVFDIFLIQALAACFTEPEFHSSRASKHLPQ